MPISIVLERTSHPGNIGAVARAMQTMGMEDLILIDSCQITEESITRARGGKHILEKATICKDESILEDFHAIYGTTSRHRSLHLPVHSSRSIAPMIHAESHQSVAILFGNEKHGLSNALLNCCQAIIEIPATQGHSLNLSHAVQIICYELNQQLLADNDTHYASLKDRQAFLSWLQEYYTDTSFLLPHTLTRIASILNKAKLTPQELRLLYSLISSK